MSRLLAKSVGRRFGWLAASALIAAWLWPQPTWAQEPADVTKIAEFIRWTGVAFSLLVIAGAAVVLRIVHNLGERLGARFANRRPSIQKAESIVRFVVYVVTAAICVGLSVRLDDTAVAVIGGALAFAVGFAMRDLVAAFIAGVTIMFDRPFQVGDRVAYAGEYGDIIKIGLRSVQMNTLDHNIVTIPNNKVLTDVTSSGNYGALEMQVAMDFYIGVDQDVERAMEIVREACLTSPYIFLKQPVPVLIKQVILDNYVAVHIKARPYVFDCRYEKPFETDVHLRVLRAFRQAGIAPPAVLHRVREDGPKGVVPPGASR
ncbi:MAG: mechanosensitive ion channel family protein [Deltaproteobacteria bacterium]|nr:MAG: mechanosensitive ion channel family protein [Deltaproteobacteria bacterium]